MRKRHHSTAGLGAALQSMEPQHGWAGRDLVHNRTMGSQHGLGGTLQVTEHRIRVWLCWELPYRSWNHGIVGLEGVLADQGITAELGWKGSYGL